MVAPNSKRRKPSRPSTRAGPITRGIQKRQGKNTRTESQAQDEGQSEDSSAYKESDQSDDSDHSGDEDQYAQDESDSNEGHITKNEITKKKRKRRTKPQKTITLPTHDDEIFPPELSTIPLDENGLELPKTPAIKPTLYNYRELADQWSTEDLDHYLACTKALCNSQIPPDILNEARALEDELASRLKVLSLAGGVSYETLRYGVHRTVRDDKQNPYQVFRKFSLAATVDNIMPQTVQKNTNKTTESNDKLAESSEDPLLRTYNNKVCAVWQQIKDTPDEKVFGKQLFNRIALVISNNVDDLDVHEHLSIEEQEYVPTFHRLVNIKKVKDELALSRHPSQSARYQEKGIRQMELIHSSLQATHKSYGIHYHLLVASWTPTTTNRSAGWSKEFSSDPVYLTSFSTRNHLLERFDRFATRRTTFTQKGKQDGVSSANDQLRKDFTTALNGLVSNHLKHVKPKLIKPRVHMHPKKGQCDKLLKRIMFPNDIRLAVHQTIDSQVTAEMLSAGPAAIMNNQELMRVWHQDILAHRYTVISVHENLSAA